jgi:hypothetical protein
MMRASIVVWLAIAVLLNGCSQKAERSSSTGPAAARRLSTAQSSRCTDTPAPAEPPMCR